MNIRKPVDYSMMYATIETLMLSDLEQTKLFCEIGKVIDERPEKGAAVAAAEYINAAFPDRSGFSPRSLRRMRDFYRAYKNDSALMEEAMGVSWSLNALIIENCEEHDTRKWYVKACLYYGWSKQELSVKITENAHENTILDTETRVWYTEPNNQSMEEQKHDKDTVCLLWEYMPQSNGGVRDEGFGTKSWSGKAVRDCLRSDQYGRDRESGISSGPAQTRRAWNQLYWQGGSAVEEQRLRSIRSTDWNGPCKPAEYVSYLWRRLRPEDALDDGLYRPPWRGCRSVVYGRFRGYLAGCSGGLSRVA